MVKPKIPEETKEQRFKRIASSRTRKILNDIRLLGNCSNKGVYLYKEEEVNKIFSTIEKELKRMRALFKVSSQKNSFRL